jgi:hypothetical protein
VFAPIFAIFGLLFFASTLPNGIRLVELPDESDSIEIVAGYTAGGLLDFDSTPAAKSFLRDAYAAGAVIEFIDEVDRTAIRITTPKWSLPMLVNRIAPLFEADLRVSTARGPSADFRAKVEEEVRAALLGLSPDTPAFSTSDAFVLISGPAPDALRQSLAAIPKRGATRSVEELANRLPGERTLRFKSDLPEGGVIFASPLPGVYYRQWYQVLLLDRLIRRAVPLRVTTTFPLTIQPYYYRLEVPVPGGQLPEPVEENLLQELQRLVYARANDRELNAAHQEAIAYLDSRPVREWFASQDMMSRREEGIQWIQAMTADDMRVTARDLLMMNRVIATWSPKPRQSSVGAEPLSASDGSKPPAPAATPPRPVENPQTDVVTAFPQHTHPTLSMALPEQLSSGVSIVTSNRNAVFVSGGSITRFDREFTAEDLKQFAQYRSSRILVLVTPASMSSARQLWSAFKGASSGETGVSRGKVSNGDLTALFILKNILDLRLIANGWWREVPLRIDAGSGTDLQIQAPEDKRAQVLDWIKGVANAGVPDAYYTWVREVTMHRFDTIRGDLQALIWERDPQGSVQDPETVPLRHVQDVARIYF